MGSSFSQIVGYCSDLLALLELCDYKTMEPGEKNHEQQAKASRPDIETRVQ